MADLNAALAAIKDDDATPPVFTGNESDGDELITLDISKLDVPPAGKYAVRIRTEPKVGLAKSSGAKMMTVSMEITAPDAHIGLYIMDNWMLEGPGMARTKNAFDAFGLPYQSRPSAFVGAEAIVSTDVTDNPRYGKRAQVKRYYPIGG